jgi:flagellar hook protein FlgE
VLGDLNAPALSGFAIQADGQIMGSFEDGTSAVVGQVAIAMFPHGAGLLREADNTYAISATSGEPTLGFAGDIGRGEITAGALEMSNVDITRQFTNMIMAQRGFQANSRIITVSDEMLQDVVNLKR